MMGILIPVSNSGCERVFNLVRRNRTDFCSSMSADTTEALTVLKCKGGLCYDSKLSDTLLKKYKQATSDHLRK